MDWRRFAILATVAICANFFVAPASFFQNRYLADVRDFSGGMIGVFSIAVGTPASISRLMFVTRLPNESTERIVPSIFPGTIRTSGQSNSTSCPSALSHQS